MTFGKDKYQNNAKLRNVNMSFTAQKPLLEVVLPK